MTPTDRSNETDLARWIAAMNSRTPPEKALRIPTLAQDLPAGYVSVVVGVYLGTVWAMNRISQRRLLGRARPRHAEMKCDETPVEGFYGVFVLFEEE